MDTSKIMLITYPDSLGNNRKDLKEMPDTSALGDDDDSCLLAWAVQLFAPGTPQVYCQGMPAGPNDRKILAMMKFRSECPAFDGSFEVKESDDSALVIERRLAGVNEDGGSADVAVLSCDFKTKTFTVTHNGVPVEF